MHKKHNAIFAQTLTGGLLADYKNRDEYALFMQDVITLFKHNREKGIITSQACSAEGTCPPPPDWENYWDNIVYQSQTLPDDTLSGINKAKQDGQREYYNSVKNTMCSATNNMMVSC